MGVELQPDGIVLVKTVCPFRRGEPFYQRAEAVGRRAHNTTFCLYLCIFLENPNPLLEHQSARRVIWATFKQQSTFPQQLKGSVVLLFIVLLSSSVYKSDTVWGFISGLSLYLLCNSKAWFVPFILLINILLMHCTQDNIMEGWRIVTPPPHPSLS